ncbi:MAG: ABC transporter permease [Maricaulaceae bacterium]|nr:ABC transporter permease [Maricaulaceae bacterium]
MNPLAALPVALNSLRVNALRSLLAMLGVVIGVGSVIVMVSISEGAKQAVEQQIASLGANLLVVRPGSSAFGGRRGGAGTATLLTDADVDAIRNEVANVAAASGEIGSSAAMVAGGTNWTTRIQGVNEDFFRVRDWRLERGRLFTAEEFRAGARVAVIGTTVAEQLFGVSDPVGQVVRIGNVPVEVIGVLQSKGQSAFGTDQDDVAFMPATTARSRVIGFTFNQRDPVFAIYVELAGGANPAHVQADIEELLRIRRNVLPGAEDNFNVRDMAEFIRARNETAAQLGLLLAATAAISLIVGGIGIMNIMLVSVTERTREIGLRLAVGARRRNIRDQFLIESVTLCVTGGLIGLLAGVAGTMVVEAMGQFPVAIHPMVAGLAIGSAAFVGIFFGFYPAHRASRLDPIEALRFE